MSAPSTAHPGILHQYGPKHKAFEFTDPVVTPISSTAANQPANTLLFLGGLGDDFLSPNYVHSHLAPHLRSHFQGNWRLVQVQLSSGGQKWGLGSILEDAQDLYQAITYFKKLRDGKIVVMGHSTGCQDVMSYFIQLPYPNKPHIDGVIFQAPVSDREAIMQDLKTQDTARELLAISEKLIKNGEGKTLLSLNKTSLFFGNKTPICAERWYSLTAPLDEKTKIPKGDEDFFSSDIPESYEYKSTWGRIPPDTGVLVLYSEEDEFVPKELDKEALVNKWMRIMRDKGIKVDEKRSGIVPEANHDISGVKGTIMGNFLERIRGFLEWVEQGCGEKKKIS